MDRVERLANLVTYLLDVGRPVTLRNIVSEVGGYPESYDSARVQFERDKKQLIAEGVAVEMTGDGEAAAYRIDPRTYYLPELDLDDEETVALNAAASMVRFEGDDPDDALLKLGALGAEGPPVVALPSDEHLGALHDAVQQRRVARFAYNGADRDVEPYGLLCRDGFWYLAGYDRLRGGLRNFRVDRIDGAVEAARGAGAFEVPGGFDLRAALAEHPYELAPGEPVLARVRVDRPVTRRVVAEVGPDAVCERHDDGGVTVELRVTNPAGLRSWLLGLLDHARLVGPPELVDDHVAWLRAIAEAG